MNNADKMSPSELRAHDESAHADMASRIAELGAQLAELLAALRVALETATYHGYVHEANRIEVAIRRAEGGSRG